jgi:hypothetical protein
LNSPLNPTPDAPWRAAQPLHSMHPTFHAILKRMKLTVIRLTLGLSLSLALHLTHAGTQPSTIGYQGRLTDNGAPAHGNYDLRFRLYGAASGGVPMGNTVTVNSVAVTHGAFSVSLDFGAAVFDGNGRWLEIGVRTQGSTADYGVLTPRQAITAAPYALYALTPAGPPGPAGPAGAAGQVGPAGPPGTTTAEGLTSGTLSDARLSANVPLLDADNLFAGDNNFTGAARLTNPANRFAGDGSGLVNVPGTTPWQVISSSTLAAEANRGYFLNHSEMTTVTLPGSPKVGDFFTVSSIGAGGWTVMLNPVRGPWIAQPNFRRWKAIASSADGKRLVALPWDLSDPNLIYTSGDGGATWEGRAIPHYWIAVASSADGKKLVATVVEQGKLYTSADYGVTWTERALGSDYNIAGRYSGVASSADGIKLAVVDDNGRIFTSTDSGATWMFRYGLDLPSDRVAITSSSDGNILVVGSGRPIHVSVDSGATWTQRPGTPSGVTALASSADGTKLVTCTYGGQLYTSMDQGLTWTERLTDKDRGWTGVASSADGSQLVAVAKFFPGAIYTSQDFGATWKDEGMNRGWSGVTSSADGYKLAAVAGDEDGPGPYSVYTSSVSGFSLSGAAGSKVTMQYVGGDLWQPMAESQIASLDASKVTTGVLSDGRLAGTYSKALTLNNPENSYAGSFAGNGASLTGLSANNLSGTLPNSALAGTYSGAVTLNNSANRFTGDGSGLVNVPGAIPRQVVFSSDLTAEPNRAYLLNHPDMTTVALPASAAVGDTVTVSGGGAGGWKVMLDPERDPWVNRGQLRTWKAVASSADGLKLVAVTLRDPVFNDWIYTSTDGGLTWVQRGSIQLWVAVASSADGNNLVALTEGHNKIFTSRDAGVTWVERSVGEHWNADNNSAVACSADGQKLVLAGHSPIYTSADYGVTWTLQTSGGTIGSIDGRGAASTSDGATLFVASESNVYVSTDSGVTWGVAPSPRITGLVCSSDGHKLIGIVPGGFSYISTDFGGTWTAKLQDRERRWTGVACSADGVRIVAVANWDVSGDRIYTSKDFGETWTAEASERQWSAVASSSDGYRLVALADAVYTSAAPGFAIEGSKGTMATVQYLGGGLWQEMASSQFGATHVHTSPISFFNPDNSFTGDGAGLANLNADNLTTGTVPADRLATTQLKADNLASGTVPGERLAGTYPNALTFPNAGNTFAGTFSGNGVLPWQVNSSSALTVEGGNGYLLNNNAQVAVTLPVSPALGDIIRITGAGTGGFIIGQSAGQSIRTRTIPVSIAGLEWDGHDQARNWSAVASSADGKKLVATANPGQIYTSSDSGSTWTARELSRNWISVASSADGTKLVALTSQIFTSGDSGVTWTLRASTLQRNWRAVASSADGVKLVAVVSGGFIYTSTDSGVNWGTRMSDANRSWVCVTSSADGAKLVAAIDNGSLYTSTDSGVTWTQRLGGGTRRWRAVTGSDDGVKIVAGGDGKIFTSGDSGVTWVERGNIPADSLASSADGIRLISGGQQVYTSTDSGVTWIQRIGGGGGPGSVASSADGLKLVWSLGNNLIFTSVAAPTTLPSTTAGNHRVADRRFGIGA